MKPKKPDLSDPALLKPFKYGWIREVCYRSVCSHKKVDIYYYSPTKKKIRSKKQLGPFLENGLSTDNFSFFMKPLDIQDPQKQIIRMAANRKSSKEVKTVHPKDPQESSKTNHPTMPLRSKKVDCTPLSSTNNDTTEPMKPASNTFVCERTPSEILKKPKIEAQQSSLEEVTNMCIRKRIPAFPIKRTNDVVFIGCNNQIIQVPRKPITSISARFCLLLSGKTRSRARNFLDLTEEFKKFPRAVYSDFLRYPVTKNGFKLSSVSFYHCIQLLEIATIFEVDQLRDLCVKEIRKKISKKNVLTIFDKLHSIPSTTQSEMLINKCRGIIKLHSFDLFTSKGFLNIQKETLLKIMDLDNLNIPSEVDIFNACEKWVQSAALKIERETRYGRNEYYLIKRSISDIYSAIFKSKKMLVGRRLTAEMKDSVVVKRTKYSIVHEIKKHLWGEILPKVRFSSFTENELLSLHLEALGLKDEVIKKIRDRSFPNKFCHKDRDMPDQYCEELYFSYVRNHDLDKLKWISEIKPAFGIVDKQGFSLLHLAISPKKSSLKIVKWLLKKGLPINHQSNMGVTPLHLACKFSNSQVVKTLLKYGANIEILDNYGRNCLHYGVLGNSCPILRELMKAGSNANHFDYSGKAPVHLAAEKGFVESVRFLMNSGNMVPFNDLNEVHVSCYVDQSHQYGMGHTLCEIKTNKLTMCK